MLRKRNTFEDCTARGAKRNRYSVCLRAQIQGNDACPSPAIPAEEIERFAVDQIRVIGSGPRAAGDLGGGDRETGGIQTLTAQTEDTP